MATKVGVMTKKTMHGTWISNALFGPGIFPDITNAGHRNTAHKIGEYEIWHWIV